MKLTARTPGIENQESVFPGDPGALAVQKNNYKLRSSSFHN
jgi:hypothetical protein